MGTGEIPTFTYHWQTMSIEVVLKFEQLINSRNPDAVCGLLRDNEPIRVIVRRYQPASS